MWNLANVLTVTRLILLPFIILLLLLPIHWGAWPSWLALALYIVGAVTDYLDGWAARKFNQVSDFGKFMDPISDKIFVVTILIMLIATQRIEGLMVLAVVVILAREFLVSGMREFLGPKNVRLPVTQLAKWKTTVQMVGTGFFVMTPFFGFAEVTGDILLCVAAVLTVVTGWDYIKTGWAHLA